MADIHTKLAKVAGEIGSINKSERNEQQGFNFRSIEQITGAIRPLFAKEGISVSPIVVSFDSTEVTSAKGSKGFRSIVHMAYTFTAGSDGTSVETSMVGEAVDYGDKSISKAVQMAYKYALTQVLQVGSGDDPDAHSVDVGHMGEDRPRPRSGMKRTPSTPAERAVTEAARGVLADESHGNGAPSHLTPKQAIQVAGIKNSLLGRLEGDKDKARELWEGTIRNFGLDPKQPLPADMIPAVEHAIKALLI